MNTAQATEILNAAAWILRNKTGTEAELAAIRLLYLVNRGYTASVSTLRDLTVAYLPTGWDLVQKYNRMPDDMIDRVRSEVPYDLTYTQAEKEALNKKLAKRQQFVDAATKLSRYAQGFQDGLYATSKVSFYARYGTQSPAPMYRQQPIATDELPPECTLTTAMHGDSL